MTALTKVGIGVIAGVSGVVLGWEFIKTLFEIREAFIRYYVIRHLPTEPIPINQSRS